MSKFTLTFTLLLFFIFFTIYGQPIDIVKNNYSSTNIVVLEKENKQLNEIATILKDYIFKSTNAKLNIVNSINLSKNNIIIATQFNKSRYNYNILDVDGFFIKTLEGNIVISGKTDWGTEYGVYEFLERYVGVRWLMPTKKWTEIPVKPNLQVGKIEIIENPKFLSRSFFPINMENRDTLVSNWGKYNRLRNRVEFHHNLKNIFKFENVAKSNPQFFPNIDGKRYIPKNSHDEDWQPNFQLKGIDLYAANEIIKYFKQNPQAASISLGVNDSGNFDKVNSSGSINYIGKENYSNAYYSWVNRTVKIINKIIPDKKFGLLAYDRVAEPPIFKLEKNIIPFITYERLMWLDPVLKQKDIEVSKKWQQLTNEYGWYDYVYGGEYLVPRIYLHHYQYYLKVANSMNVKYYVAEYYPNWLEGPKGWIMTKLLWNPYQEVDSLLNDWCINAVGLESAIYLKQFYSIWESIWTEDLPFKNWWQINSTYLIFNNKMYIDEIRLEKIFKADEMMYKAYKSATSKKHKERVEDLLNMWSFCKMNYLYFQTKPFDKFDEKVFKTLIKSNIVTKKSIELKMAELEKHPLFQPTISIYRRVVGY